MTTDLTDTDWERAVLGACMIEPGALVAVSAIVRAEMFTLGKHRQVYEAMAQMHDTGFLSAGDAADCLLLRKTLRELGHNTTAGDLSLFSELAAAPPSVSNARYYAGEIRSAWQRRELAAGAAELAAAADSGDPDAIASARERIAALRYGDGAVAQTANTVVLAELLALAMDGRGNVDAMNTGLGGLDARMHGGFRRGELWTIGGRPGAGKSTLALAMFAAGLEHDRVMCFFSLELTREQFLSNLLAHTARVDSRGWRDPKADWKSIKDGAAALYAHTLDKCLIEETVTLTPLSLRAACLEHARQHGGIDMVFLDHLQLLGSDRQGKDVREYDRVSDASRACKLLSKELNAVVVALSQLNRLGASETPRLDHLRASGTIEQDSDGVVLIDETPANADKNEERVDFLISKQRHGPRSTIEMLFKRQRLGFEPAGHSWTESYGPVPETEDDEA